MRVHRRLSLAVATFAAVAVGTLAVAPSASATGSTAPRTTAPGTRSLAAALTSDGNTFDRNWYDYDIVTEAVLAVLKAKPKSPVGLLANGNVALTAFIPNDRAFQLLVKDLTGKKLTSEKAVFGAVAGLGINTVETVLLYHVVPGATITARQALKANGAKLTTAQGGTITVKVPLFPLPLVVLKDNDPDDKDPFVVQFDINKGNKQIAHGISYVLRPVNL
jgi:uncharacterized surface protein with fasciclin (FAS1) repeats